MSTSAGGSEPEGVRSGGVPPAPVLPPARQRHRRRGVRSRIDRERRRPRGRVYASLRWGGALVFVAVVVALLVSLVWQSAPAFRHSGFSFLFNGTWNPDTEQFGAGVFIVDTLITTGIGLLLAIIVGIATAAALSEFLPRRIAAPLSTCIDLLAAVPSIVVGLWGLFVLVPIFPARRRALPAEDPAGTPSLQLAGTSDRAFSWPRWCSRS